MDKPQTQAKEHFVDCFSVENIPNTKFSAVFVNKCRQSFREDADLQTDVTVDHQEFVPWGVDNVMPYDIIDLIEGDETLSTCQVFNSEVCYGSGLLYNVDKASKDVKDAVDEFLLDNPMPDYFLGVCQDLKYFNFAVTVICLNTDGDKIVEIHRKEACYCRFAPHDDLGVIPYVLYGNFRNQQHGDKFEKIPLLNPRSPWKDLMQRMGKRTRRDGSMLAGADRKFAILTRIPGADTLYYPIPHYASLFRGSWYDIKRLIGIAKKGKLSNAAPIKYVVKISPRYWDDIFKDMKILDAKERQKIVNARKREMLDFLTNTENSGSVLFTGKSLSADGRNELAHVEVECIDSKTKEGGDWESDIAEAINMICFTMRVHSNLVGSVPGKTQTNNSGSDKRELYTIAQALQKPYRDVLFAVHNIIIRYNGWKGVTPECPFIQLTTLDEHRDAKEVSLNNPKRDNNESADRE